VEILKASLMNGIKKALMPMEKPNITYIAPIITSGSTKVFLLSFISIVFVEY
jgi:hypothetical protein